MIEEVLLNLVIERDDAVTIKNSSIQEAPQLYRGLYIEPGQRRQEVFARWNSGRTCAKKGSFESGINLKSLKAVSTGRSTQQHATWHTGLGV